MACASDSVDRVFSLTVHMGTDTGRTDYNTPIEQI